MCEQRRTENGAWALQWQLERTSPEQTTPKTISPKDVDIVCRESEEDTNTPLFPPQQQSLCHQHQRQSTLSPKPPKSNENASERSHSSVATAEQGSSSAYSTSPQAAQQQGRQMPQQYPFIPRSRKQPSSLPSVTNDFPTTLASMESSSSEYAPEILEGKKPLEASADTRTYTCTYHGCALRFDTLAKLQRHKREGHRNSASVINGGDGRGMTSAGQRNSQAGPHKVRTTLQKKQKGLIPFGNPC